MLRVFTPGMLCALGLFACSSSTTNESLPDGGGASGDAGAAGSAGGGGTAAVGGDASASGAAAGSGGSATGGTGSGGSATGGTGGGGGTGGCKPASCAGACKTTVSDGCGSTLNCGLCPTGQSCVAHVCDKTVITGCTSCGGQFPTEVATIPNMPLCGAVTDCSAPGTLRVCAKDLSNFGGVRPGGCLLGETQIESLEDCGGQKKFVCAVQ